jgi:hypothetical protein
LGCSATDDDCGGGDDDDDDDDDEYNLYNVCLCSDIVNLPNLQSVMDMSMHPVLSRRQKQISYLYKTIALVQLLSSICTG